MVEATPPGRLDSSVAGSSKLAVDHTDSSDLVQSVAKFIQVQTDMMAAQMKAMASQTLPPLPHFSGR